LIGKEEASVLGIINVEQKVQWMAEKRGELSGNSNHNYQTSICPATSVIFILLLNTNLCFHDAGIDEIRACANVRFFTSSVRVGRANWSATGYCRPLFIFFFFWI
jgi:hypothetical protein